MKTDRDGRLTTGCRSNRLVTKQRNCKPPWFQPANWSKWFNESLQRPASKGQRCNTTTKDRASQKDATPIRSAWYKQVVREKAI